MEKQRKAEQALLRAEEARRQAAEAAAAADAAARRPSTPQPTVPGVTPDAATAPTPGAEETVPTPAVSPGTEETTVLRPVREERAEDAGKAGSGPDAEVTAELPQPPAPSGAADETAVLPPVVPGAADETAVLPPVSADETAVLPPVRGDDPAERVPRGFFRDERPAAGPDGSEDRTREMPQIDAEGTPRRRPRPDWAEETPLDDLPTLADELLGSYDEQKYGDTEEDQGGRGRGRGRRG